MDHFSYVEGRLRCESADLGELAAHVGTPAYVYSRATLADHVQRARRAFAEIDPLLCFAVKACSNIHVLGLLAELGCGMDVVSGGELFRARLAGAPADKIVYAGVGKTAAEIRDALALPAADEQSTAAGAAPKREPIGLFNIESEGEFHAIASIAHAAGVTARAALRVNPDVDAGTHEYTATGKLETKFGVDIPRARQFFARYAGHPALRLAGIHLHIGSPINSTQPYISALTRALSLADDLAAAGIAIDTLDIGGGFAADYETGASLTAADYAAAIVPMLRGRSLRVILEPGRTIAANAGVLLTRVLYVKQSGHKKFLVCDAGMQTLIRPALYGSFHFVWPASVAPQHVPAAREERPPLPGLEDCDVVGPVCETGDFLARARPLPPVAPGDLLAVFAAGAYGMTMASRYNSHPLPAEVLIDGPRATVIRERETYQDLVHHETHTRELGI